MDLRSGAAFWPIQNGLLQTYPALDRDERSDVVVIGAGVTGALVAQRLATSGVNVVVLDKRDVADGSTSATTGLLLYETDTSLVELAAATGVENAVRAWRAGREAVDRIESLCATLGDRCGFERVPALYLASSRRDAKQLLDEQQLRCAHGFETETLAPADLRQRYGIDAPGALFRRSAGQIDAYRFTHRLLASAVNAGARVYDRTDVTAVASRDGATVVRTARGPHVAASRVVWATGYEAVEDVKRHVGSRHSTWALMSEPLADLGSWRDRAVIWETARPYLYARTTADGRVALGGEDEPFSRRHANDRLRTRKARRLVDRFHRLFPDLQIEIAYEWAGVFTTTADGLPRIGAVPEHPDAWLALAYGGNGITFAAIAADIIHDAWHGRANPDARLFGFDRT